MRIDTPIDCWLVRPGARRRTRPMVVRLAPLLIDGAWLPPAWLARLTIGLRQIGRGQVMEFGMFHEFPSLPGRSESEAFDEAMEQVDAAERWGLDVMWLAELHFEPRRSLLSAPLSIASAIAARTRRISR